MKNLFLCVLASSFITLGTFAMERAEPTIRQEFSTIVEGISKDLEKYRAQLSPKNIADAERNIAKARHALDTLTSDEELNQAYRAFSRTTPNFQYILGWEASRQELKPILLDLLKGQKKE